MTWIRELWRQLRYRLSGARFDEDLADEMRLHLDLRAADKRAGGLGPDAAQAAARRQFGNATQLQESSRAAWGWTRLDSWRQDIRYGLRTLAANPGFTVTAVLSLALGIGANTAIFSILNAVLLRSLPLEDPQRLVQIRIGAEGDDELTNPIWEQVRDRQQAFSGALAYAPDRFDLADGGESRYSAGLWVSGDFFRVLGVPAIQGRVFTRDEDRRGTAPLAVISYNFWKRNFPGEDSPVGKTVRLNRHTFEIVGVTPPWFRGLDTDWGFDVAIPIACDPIFHPGHSALDERAEWWLRILGRMPAGESIERARDRMRAIAPEIFRATVPHDFPTEAQNQYLNNSFFLKPAATGFSEMGAQYRTALFTLMAIVGVVLLIACANIANLLLARAAARQREFSVRMAIGAGRARVIRQLMTESLLLSMFGTAAGLLLASWGGRVLVHFLSTKRHPLDMDLSLDPRVLAFTIGAAILTAVLFGLAPALRATRVELNQVMKENGRGALRASGRFNPGKALVAGQVALSLMLLVAAGLFLGTLRNLWAVDPGFTRHNILIITADAEQAAVPAAKRANTYREILGRLRALPGVAAAASSVLTPISPEGWAQMVRPEGFASKASGDTLLFLNRVSPGYFATLRTPRLLGRDFSDRDSLNAPKAMIVNESAARQFFGAADHSLYSAVGRAGGDADPRRARRDYGREPRHLAGVPQPGNAGERIAVAAANRGAALVRFRIVGAAAGHGGPVWDYVVRGDAAQRRDRDSDGPGRAARVRCTADVAGRSGAAGARNGGGLGGIAGCRPAGDEPAIRRAAEGPGATGRRGADSGGGNCRRGVCARAARGAPGSDGGFAVGVEAEMLVAAHPPAAIAIKRNGRPGKIKGAAIQRGDYLHGIGIGYI